MSGADRCDEIVRIIDEALADAEAHRPAAFARAGSRPVALPANEDSLELN